MREWSIQIFVVGPRGEELPANMFDKATYHLHPTFQNPTRHLKKPPFKLTERGWGEFDMEIVLTTTDKQGTHSIRHDLHFQKPSYETTHKIVRICWNSQNIADLLLTAEDIQNEKREVAQNFGPIWASPWRR